MKKHLVIIIPAIVVLVGAGVGFYIWKKKKGASGESQPTIDSGGISAPANMPKSTLSKINAVKGGTYNFVSVVKDQKTGNAVITLDREMTGIPPQTKIQILSGAYKGKTATIMFHTNNINVLLDIPFTTSGTGTFTKL